MYIRPDSNIKIYSGVPLDNSYENTLWFDSISDQNSYFHGNYNILKHTLTAQSYQRVVKGTMRVQIPAEDLYDCNYLAFQNEGFGYKWFYAFILSVEYINNETSEITFEIDIMQTYLFDVRIRESFVEREHSSTDEIGDNLVEENLELGDYVIDSSDFLGLTNYKIVVLTAETYSEVPPDPDNPFAPFGPTWSAAPITNVGGILQCAQYFVFNSDTDGINQLQSLINTFNEKPDEIIGVFLMPEQFTESIGKSTPHSITKTVSKNYGSFDYYTPRNNKLYTYPYNFLYVTNMQGNSGVFPYEYFSEDVCRFEALCIATANAEIALFPRNYKGLSFNRDEYMILKGFPQCAYNVDAFKAWLAQNTGSIAGSLLATAVGGIIGVGLGGAALPALAGETIASGALLGSGVSVFNTLAKIRDKSVQPIQTKGNDTGSVLAGDRQLDFYFYNKRIRGEFARIIDDYFDVYGYATHKVKIPNRCVRQRWTYTKTVGCNAIGECPADDIKRIKQIYDKGITFWVNPSEVGNYSLSNNPL